MYWRCCCGTPTANCDCFVCTYHKVIISDTGTALDGEYFADWDPTTASWNFDAGGCDWRIKPSDTINGNIDRVELSPSNGCILEGNCEYVGGASEFVIEPSDDLCDWCGLGDLIGGKIRIIPQPREYPEYIEVRMPFVDGTCDCSGVNNLQIPIYCGPFGGPDIDTGVKSLSFRKTLATTCPVILPQSLTCRADYFCVNVGTATRIEIKIGNQQFTGPLKLSKLVSGDDFTVPFDFKIGSDDPYCELESSITVRGMNPGVWC